MAPVIEVEHLTHQYGKQIIYEDLNFTISPGKFYAPFYSAWEQGFALNDPDDLKEVPMSLEDAFIGYTGRY